MCFLIDTQTFEITKMETLMKKSKKFIKFKDFTLRQGDKYIYAVDDDNEIHQLNMQQNQWSLIETSREN